MSQTNIAVIVGSLRRDSFNVKFAQAIAKLAPTDFMFKHSQIGDLPLYIRTTMPIKQSRSNG